MEIPIYKKYNTLPIKNVNTPIDENVKDNKYNNNNKNINKYNNANQNYKKSKANFEERDYTGYDFTKIYANANIIA